MNLDFISEALEDICRVEIAEYEGCECAVISADGFKEVIEVLYFPDGYHKYGLNYASWHMDTSSREELFDCIMDFVDAQLAAIEFFDEGVASFGGAIDISVAENINYSTLKGMFEDDEDITGLTFSVRAWDSYCCYDGRFVKHELEGYTVFRVYEGTADC